MQVQLTINNSSQVRGGVDYYILKRGQQAALIRKLLF